MRSAPNPPELGGTEVAEDRVVAARENGRHPSASLAESAVTDGLNTTVNRVEAPGARAL
jgi:hypothetical protein